MLGSGSSRVHASLGEATRRAWASTLPRPPGFMNRDRSSIGTVDAEAWMRISHDVTHRQVPAVPPRLVHETAALDSWARTSCRFSLRVSVMRVPEGATQRLQIEANVFNSLVRHNGEMRGPMKSRR